MSRIIVLEKALEIPVQDPGKHFCLVGMPDAIEINGSSAGAFGLYDLFFHAVPLEKYSESCACSGLKAIPIASYNSSKDGIEEVLKDRKMREEMLTGAWLPVSGRLSIPGPAAKKSWGKRLVIYDLADNPQFINFKCKKDFIIATEKQFMEDYAGWPEFKESLDRAIEDINNEVYKADQIKKIFGD